MPFSFVADTTNSIVNTTISFINSPPPPPLSRSHYYLAMGIKVLYNDKDLCMSLIQTSFHLRVTSSSSSAKSMAADKLGSCLNVKQVLQKDAGVWVE